MLYPTELQARAGILAGYGTGVKCGGVSYARNYARQLPRHVLAVGGTHDVVAIEDGAGLVSGHGHRRSLDDASVHHVADGRSPEVVMQAPVNACLLACRDPGLPEVPNTLPPEPA